MTPILVLATFATIILVELYRDGRRSHVAEVARASAPCMAGSGLSTPSPGTLFHPGHTWVRIHDDGIASVGVSDFASNFAGDLAAVELPREGRRIRQAEPACTLISARDRRLTLSMPVEGTVLAVNRELLKDPGLAQRRPYDAGWILRIRPRKIRADIRNLMPCAAAQPWIDAARASITARMNPALGALAHDGGEWLKGFGDRLDDEDWLALKRQLFPDGDSFGESA